ncbi:MAG: VOC family protein [SAR324 cluster bacterium]|nr:VOC family protein [SAR324 cluster bacterium]
MELGTFSISLAVKDIGKSKNFYEKLGFSIFGGDQLNHWLIMKNKDHVIGLFQGMFESNILTFNPGWDNDGKKLESFTDVREILDNLKSQGIEIAQESIVGETGPSSFSMIDPDGNTILIDQHV